MDTALSVKEGFGILLLLLGIAIKLVQLVQEYLKAKRLLRRVRVGDRRELDSNKDTDC